MDKEWFEKNHLQLDSLLSQLHIDSKEDFDEFQINRYKALDAKGILTGDELMSLPAEPDNYIVEHLLWEEDIAILLAKEKAGKSIFSMQLACALTCGEPFLGKYDIPEAKRVLYVQAEGSRQETVKRFREMQKHVNWNPKNFFHYYPPALSLDTEEGLHAMQAMILNSKVQPDVIILDPLYMSMEGELCSDMPSRMFCRHIRVLKSQFNCAFLINHHKRRPTSDKKGNEVDRGDNEIMGSFVWKAFPSHILNLTKRPDQLRTLTCETQRGGAVVKNMLLELVEPSPLFFRVCGNTNYPEYYDDVLGYIRKNKKPVTYDNIMLVTGLSRSAVNKALTYWKNPEVAKVCITNLPRRPHLYGLRKKEKV